MLKKTTCKLVSFVLISASVMAVSCIDNNYDLNKEKTYSGDLLELYEGEELFVGNSKANQLLTREYRYPFVVPPTII